MKCPFCGGLESQVIDSRVSETAESIRRRRCLGCKRRFTTYELVDVRFASVYRSFQDLDDFRDVIREL